MLIAGLTGGMACGKSFVASELRRLGAHTIEADELGHEVIGPGGEAHDAVLQAFGTTDRAELASLVFGKPGELARLNAIVHPAVRERAAKMVAGFVAADPAGIVVYVAAILFESGGMPGMKKTIVVTCSPEQQLERALERPGATREKVMARLAHQMPMAEKLAKADYIVDTNGTKEDTLRQTKLIFEELRRLAA
ncbi:MAG TPA: dephospho-CoA kinase [Bryobacteraceae bacterium]|nr:dephospho-CoA kinase [Bryobacteraceae bacterium]